MTAVTIELPWTVPPISLNDRGHWAPRAKKIREVRETGYFLARKAKVPPCTRIRVELHYQPAVRRRREGENLVGTQKPLIDGLVDAGIVPDDTDEFVERYGPVIHPADKTQPGRMWLVISPSEQKEATG